jgi:hypothetical protein
MATYNGHPSYNAWNVALWLSNDERAYRLARACRDGAESARVAAELFIGVQGAAGRGHTPDGVRYTITNVMRAMRGLV